MKSMVLRTIILVKSKRRLLNEGEGVFFEMMSDKTGATFRIKVISCLNIQLNICRKKLAIILATYLANGFLFSHLIF